MDYFLVLRPSHVSRSSLRAPFDSFWKLTVQILSNTTPTISHDGLNVSLNDDGINMETPNLTSKIMRDNNLQTLPQKNSTLTGRPRLYDANTSEKPKNPTKCR